MTDILIIVLVVSIVTDIIILALLRPYIWYITHEAFEKGYKVGKLDRMKENIR